MISGDGPTMLLFKLQLMDNYLTVIEAKMSKNGVLDCETNIDVHAERVG